MFSTCRVSSYIGNCAWINTIQQLNGIMQDNPFTGWKKENTPVAPHHCYPDAPYLSGQQVRAWHYWVLGACRTSYPAHFTILSQTGVISPISWMNASAPDARALPHICVQHRGSPSLSWALRIWVLDLGHSFMRRCTISGPYVSPQEARSRFLDKWWAVSQISCRVQ